MKSPDPRSRSRNRLFYVPVAMVCGALVLPPDPSVFAQQAQAPVMTTTTTTEEEAPKIPNDQLDSLVAPIALYPDPLLSQALVASTYPLEIIQLEQWMAKNKNLKDKALADAVAKQPWDPSIQGLAAFPDVVARLAENVSWTSDLGNAFLAQQADVMAAVQRMRAKAQGTGNLKTSSQQKVETQEVEGKQVIVVQQANPEVVYVPSYDPAVVYGPPVYPYPSYSYPGYVPGMALAFGTGLVLGAAWGGGWGYGCGWGHGDVNVNYNNNYNRNNINNINRNNINRSGNNQWQHNAAHRGSVPYGNKQVANKYGGTARNPGNRPGGGTGPGNRPGGGTGPGNRPGGGTGPGNRPGGGTGPGNRPGGGNGPGNRPGGGTGPGNRPGGGNRPSTKPATRPSGGGANKIGNHSVKSSYGGGGFGGGSGGAARSASSRGGHSMGGGGFSHGGGSRGGGGHGGGRGGGGGGRGGGRRR
jgi:hypothetical protein